MKEKTVSFSAETFHNNEQHSYHHQNKEFLGGPKVGQKRAVSDTTFSPFHDDDNNDTRKKIDGIYTTSAKPMLSQATNIHQNALTTTTTTTATTMSNFFPKKGWKKSNHFFGKGSATESLWDIVGMEKSIDRVQFSLLGPEEIRRMSVVRIYETGIYDVNLPHPHGILDHRMGTVDRRIVCGTCGNGVEQCNGHPGHIELPFPMYHVGYIDVVLKILRSCCVWCSRLLLAGDPEKLKAVYASVSRGNSSNNNNNNNNNNKNTDKNVYMDYYCGGDTCNEELFAAVAQASKGKKVCDFCKAPQPLKFSRFQQKKSIQIHCEWAPELGQATRWVSSHRDIFFESEDQTEEQFWKSMGFPGGAFDPSQASASLLRVEPTESVSGVLYEGQEDERLKAESVNEPKKRGKKPKAKVPPPSAAAAAFANSATAFAPSLTKQSSKKGEDEAQGPNSENTTITDVSTTSTATGTASAEPASAEAASADSSTTLLSQSKDANGEEEEEQQKDQEARPENEKEKQQQLHQQNQQKPKRFIRIYKKENQPLLKYEDERAFVKRAFSQFDAYQVLKNITDDDCAILGFDPRHSRPEHMMMEVLLVGPPIIRPSIAVSEGSRAKGQDDMTHKLQYILKSIGPLERQLKEEAADVFILSGPGPSPVLFKLIDELQYHVATLFNNDLRGITKASQRSGADMKSITGRLKGKRGRIRENMMGKRVDFSARSTISPESGIGIDEVGLPDYFATKLTVPCLVKADNIQELTRIVKLGPAHPEGAMEVHDSKGFVTDLSLAHVRGSVQLQIGWIVERKLRNGDYVLVNRQPSLHKPSMMAHRVRLMPGRTIRLHPAVTTPYNADFDGDEMNIHVPRSLSAIIEAETIMSVVHQLITPQSNKPVVQIVQDGISGSYLMTRKDTFFDKVQAMDLLLKILTSPGAGKRGPDTPFGRKMVLPPPAILKPKALWTGKQLFSMLLPDTLCLEKHVRNAPQAKEEEGGKGLDMMDPGEGFVCVVDGELLSGALCKGTLGSSMGGFIHRLSLDYGPDRAARFMTDCHFLVNGFLNHRGLSIGMSDCVISKEATARIQRACLASDNAIAAMLKKSRQARIPDAEMEPAVKGILDNVLNVAGKVVQSELDDKNRFHVMVKSGAKGSIVNETQVMGCVGQTSVEGKRPSAAPGTRLLASIRFRDDASASRGMVTTNYADGLFPDENFLHAMGAREGLVDTAVKTAETGYQQRRLMKGMETVSQNYDNTIRNSSGMVLQFSYGCDGMDATFLEPAQLYNLSCSCQAFDRAYDSLFSFCAPLLEDDVDRAMERKAALPFVNSALSWKAMAAAETYRCMARFAREESRRLRAHVFNNQISSTVYIPFNVESVLAMAQRRSIREDQLDLPVAGAGASAAGVSSFGENTVSTTTKKVVARGYRSAEDQLLHVVCRLVTLIRRISSHSSSGNVDHAYEECTPKEFEKRAGVIEKYFLLQQGKDDNNDDNTNRGVHHDLINNIPGEPFSFSWQDHQEKENRRENGYNNEGGEEQEQTEKEKQKEEKEGGNSRDREIKEYESLVEQGLALFGLTDAYGMQVTAHMRNHILLASSAQKLLGLTRKSFDWFVDTVAEKHRRSMVQAGEMVGAIAAQSLAAPIMQMTLNTFHSAGLTTKSVTLGVPRVKELCDVSKKPSNRSMVIALQKKYAKKESRMTTAIRNELEYKLLRDIVDVSEVVFSPLSTDSNKNSNNDNNKDNALVKEEDEKMMMHANVCPAVLTGPSRFVIRLLLDKPLMAGINMDTRKVADVIQSFFDSQMGATSAVQKCKASTFDSCAADRSLVDVEPVQVSEIIYSDVSEPEWSIVIRLSLLKNMVERQGIEEEIRKDMERNIMQKVLGVILNDIHLGGLPSIHAAFIATRKVDRVLPETGELAPVVENIIETNGSSLQDVMTLGAVQWEDTVCNDVYETNEVLGIEAAAQVLFYELRLVLMFDGSYINDRHPMMLMDTMTHRGWLMPMTRHGINRVGAGPLEEASFEETTDRLFSAAAFSEVQHVKGVTPNVMLGKTGDFGSGVPVVITEPFYMQILDEGVQAQRKPKVVKTQVHEDLFSSSFSSSSSLPVDEQNDNNNIKKESNLQNDDKDVAWMDDDIDLEESEFEKLVQKTDFSEGFISFAGTEFFESLAQEKKQQHHQQQQDHNNNNDHYKNNDDFGNKEKKMETHKEDLYHLKGAISSSFASLLPQGKPNASSIIKRNNNNNNNDYQNGAEDFFVVSTPLPTYSAPTSTSGPSFKRARIDAKDSDPFFEDMDVERDELFDHDEADEQKTKDKNKKEEYFAHVCSGTASSKPSVRRDSYDEEVLPEKSIAGRNQTYRENQRSPSPDFIIREDETGPVWSLTVPLAARESLIRESQPKNEKRTRNFDAAHGAATQNEKDENDPKRRRVSSLDIMVMTTNNNSNNKSSNYLNESVPQNAWDRLVVNKQNEHQHQQLEHHQKNVLAAASSAASASVHKKPPIEMAVRQSKCEMFTMGDGTGDITKKVNQQAFSEWVCCGGATKNMNHSTGLVQSAGIREKAILVTADGGMEVQDPNAQESSSIKLIYSEALLVKSCTRAGGSAIIKVFDLFTAESAFLIYALSLWFEEVYIVKPFSSRPCSSEKYMVLKSRKYDYSPSSYSQPKYSYPSSSFSSTSVLSEEQENQKEKEPEAKNRTKQPLKDHEKVEMMMSEHVETGAAVDFEMIPDEILENLATYNEQYTAFQIAHLDQALQMASSILESASVTGKDVKKIAFTLKKSHKTEKQALDRSVMFCKAHSIPVKPFYI